MEVPNLDKETLVMLKQTLRQFIKDSMRLGGPNRYFPNRPFVIWDPKGSLEKINLKRESVYSELQELEIFMSHTYHYGINDVTHELEIIRYTFDKSKFFAGIPGAVTTQSTGIRKWKYPI
jgi:hypothetical protein